MSSIAQHTGLQHFTDENFESEVLQSDRPVLVDFYADWCGPCHVLAPAIEEVAKDVGSEAVVGKLNIDEHSEAAQAYRINSGTAEYVENDAQLLDRLSDDEYGGRVERAIVFHIHAWDMNCPQHIKPRFTEEDLAPTVEQYQRRISELEAEIHRLVGGNVARV